MKYLVIIVAAVALGIYAARNWLEKPEPVDPIQIIITQLKTHALVEHERQIAIWYRVCPDVIGVDPQIFVAWPAKLSYELPLGDVQLERSGDVLKVRTTAIAADEPAVPTDFLDYLSTDSLFTFADEQKLVNDEVRKASAIARYLSAYYLRRDASLREDFAREVRSLVARLSDALGAGVKQIEVEIPEAEARPSKLPMLELCKGSTASVNGLPFARLENGYVSPIGFAPAAPRPDAPPVAEAKGIASVYRGGKK
jgi:hypothetical protein